MSVATEPESHVALADPFRGRRLLCVEDDPSIRTSLAEALLECGFEVRCAADGPDAIALFREEGADLVVLDLGLPGMDGIAVCQELKAMSGEAFLPVLFLTARSTVETMVHALERGGDDFCAKPFLIEELTARIKVLLRVRERELRLEQRSELLRRASLADPLTGLGNRRALDDTLAREWARAERQGQPLALLLVDIDRFKQVNDAFGHSAGDRALIAVAGAITNAIREGDQVFRFGGEEFAVIIPAATCPGALQIADRVRRAVSATALETGHVTVSIGVSLGPASDRPTIGDLFQVVDHALYSAKAAGRDRVVAAWPASTRASAVTKLPPLPPPG
jgi:diguanylate cyclase (GGDEF)-like protein